MSDLGKMLPTASTQQTTSPAIELSAVEETLKRLLLDVAHFIDSSSPNTPEHPPGRRPTILRFTGGWVRDKLLGADSQDIDVAINNMTGLQFGLEMQKYLNAAGNPRKYGIGSSIQLSAESVPEGGDERDQSSSKGARAMGGLHKIEANPEKSKHLETVTTKVLGLDIDLVNLRTETYSEASRNPQMAFGTPEEDALRRDATVNALFYNLNTSSVEDFTGLGLGDMRSKILRTPLEPRQTFLDDPLRVLRLIRFASRLDYSIEFNTEEAMDDDIIRSALKSKISRERVGIEMEKMLKGKSPAVALNLIRRLHLYSTIFPAPPGTTGLMPVMSNWPQAYVHLDRLIQTSRLTVEDGRTSEVHDQWTVASTLLPDSQHVYNAWLLAALVPWRDTTMLQPAKQGARPLPLVPATVAREGIRVPNRSLAVISAAFSNANAIASLQRRVAKHVGAQEPASRESQPIARDELGMAMRRWGVSWRSQVLLSILLDTVRSDAADVAQGGPSIINGYAAFLRLVKNFDLLEAHSIKPLVNGKDLMNAFKAVSGPWLKEALDVAVAWQLRNPGVTDTQGVIREVERNRLRLKIP